jgi:SAM-dependent methyltransferase
LEGDWFDLNLGSLFHSAQVGTGAKLNWLTKAKVFWFLHYAPGGRALHYWMQRHLTKTLPRPLSTYDHYLQSGRQRRDSLALIDGSLAGKVMLEFGAGWDLFYNIALYGYGLDRQILVDLNPYMRFELVNDVIENFAKNPPQDFVRRPVATIADRSLMTLVRLYGIEYRAPADARKLDIPGQSIDFVATTSTLEHIPFDALEDIMRECGRVCKAEGLICMRIDYSDHYAHSDGNITLYNFLRFSEDEWRHYNPPNHYQNRKRHSDYRKLFERLGFTIVKDEADRPANWEEMLRTVPLHPELADYEIDDLGITGGLFVMRPPSPSCR